MNFCCQDINGPIVFDENHPGVLTVENPEVFTRILMSLQDLLHGCTEECCFYEDNEPILADKRMELIINPFAADPNQKKVLNVLYGLLSKQMWTAENFQLSNEVFSRFQGYLAQLTEEVDYPISFAEQVDGPAIFKAWDVHLEVEDEGILERLDSYISACQEFLKKDVFFFVNLHAYLSLEQIQMLYKSAAYHKNKLFLLESHQTAHLPQEVRVILDEDLCQLNLDTPF